jgi:hypothetical protein
MDLRCTVCTSSDLKKISLACQEGLYRANTHTRMIGFLIGSRGPDMFVGTAKTTGFHQTELSKCLNPPVKWSYGKLLLWAGIFSLVALIAFVIHVNSTPPPVSSLPAKLYVIFAPIVLTFLVVAFWSHNHWTYRRRYVQWEQSFIYQRCGTISEQNFSHASAAQS